MDSNAKVGRPTNMGQEREYAVNKNEDSKEYLINKLNYINFQDETILVNFTHAIYNSSISLKAKPLPCRGETLECVWVYNGHHGLQISSFEFKDILIPDGQKLLLVKSDRVNLNKKGMSFLVPDICSDVSSREVKRNFCKDIEVRFNQNSAVFHGKLIDFNPVSFRVEVNTIPPQTFDWIDTEIPVNIQFFDRHETLYTGECRILKQTDGLQTRSYVVEPLSNKIQRLKSKEFRNTRQELVPSPDAIFMHPLTKKNDSLKVIDIAGSGFSVEEGRENAILLPGMIIPEMELNFANSFKVEGKVQVIYKKALNGTENGNRLKCGMAFMDIDTGDHGKLLSLLYQAKDHHSYFSSKVDLDELWEFFFETGFIYPRKYEFFKENKERIKDTYKKLYILNPEIARHFIYREKGRILGHMAMIRFYRKSWLIQHHAGGGGSKKAGLHVLSQIGRFINDSHGLYSTQMNYVFCYYRPENKFPDRMFGGVVRNFKNPKGCSIDTFSYFHINKKFVQEKALCHPWSLMKTEPQDLYELERFYEFHSGGLMLRALELNPDSGDIGELATAYEKAGLKRERYLFSLKNEESLKAVFVVNVADIGLNLSELTSSINIIIIDPTELSKAVLYSVFSSLFEKTELNDIPVLLYPASYNEHSDIPCEKLYNLWILNMQYTDQYFNSIQRYFKGEAC